MFITIKGGATVAKVVGTISLALLTKKNLTPTFCLPGGGHETEHCTCFIIVIMTYKRLLHQMKLRNSGLCDYCGETETCYNDIMIE